MFFPPLARMSTLPGVPVRGTDIPCDGLRDARLAIFSGIYWRDVVSPASARVPQFGERGTAITAGKHAGGEGGGRGRRCQLERTAFGACGPRVGVVGGFLSGAVISLSFFLGADICLRLL